MRRLAVSGRQSHGRRAPVVLRGFGAGDFRSRATMAPQASDRRGVRVGPITKASLGQGAGWREDFVHSHVQRKKSWCSSGKQRNSERIDHGREARDGFFATGATAYAKRRKL
jgi:hypothetical protein